VFVALGAAGVGCVVTHAPSASPAGNEAFNSDNNILCFGYVDVKHGVRSLYPLQPGRVAELLVEENQPVAAGTALMRLDDESAKLQVQEAEAALEAARVQLAQTRKLPAQYQAKRRQLQAMIESLGVRLSAADHGRARKQELFDRKLLDSHELEVAKDQVKEVEELRRAEQQKLAELELQDPTLEVRRAEANVAAQEAHWRQALRGLKERTLRAPEAGTVLRVLVGPGDLLGTEPKQPALLFCPGGRRFIRAEVEQEYASQVAVGQAARIMDDSTDGPAWQGRVASVSDWFTQRRAVVQEPLQFNDARTLEVLIELSPSQAPVRIGQRMRVEIEPRSKGAAPAQLAAGR
jgi:multidrug resistance efflux pump